MLLVKDCNYVDEDRQVRDQFVYGVSDDDFKKKLLKKGNTLTRIQAVSIGKAHETTNQEVQECCQKPPVRETTNAVFKEKPNQGLMCNYCANKKGSHSCANKRNCPAWGAVCSLCKIKNHFKYSKEYKRLQKERKPQPGNQRQSRSTKKPFVLKVDEGEAVAGSIQAPSANVGSGSGSILDASVGAVNTSTSMECSDALVSVNVGSGSILKAAPSGAQALGGAEGEFSLRDKVFRVVCLYSPNRNPARDSFLEDLHLKFDPLISTLLAGDFNCVFDRALDHRGSDPLDSSERALLLSVTCLMCVASPTYARISILPPPPSPGSGDCLNPRNWRPISLLNVDYKIAFRCITGRLLKVIHSVIKKDQTCGVPGRYIEENVVLLRDLVDFASSSGSSVAILSLDQEKALDRVDLGFMLSTLKAVGFGPSFVAWVELFYCQVRSSVSVNGYLTDLFFLSWGVRLGCPLSPLLYVQRSEMFAWNLRSNPRIHDISIPGAGLISAIVQCVDDTSLVLSSDDSIKAAFEAFTLF
ncbi:Transposon TX1 uncharacterized 149 kDa protein [Stylophora pistillata]|uniref:Transposon TX1 uncharacterized 149 kDa protein n=1 Tax=Stylophora pistillata TaxID=50429 RepID=A0A2B4RUZ6_STYPI|nr:Transposon TX1 uncharacterized 149 kDa protein [Stylophora pistillata]